MTRHQEKERVHPPEKRLIWDYSGCTFNGNMLVVVNQLS